MLFLVIYVYIGGKTISCPFYSLTVWWTTNRGLIILPCTCSKLHMTSDLWQKQLILFYLFSEKYLLRHTFHYFITFIRIEIHFNYSIDTLMISKSLAIFRICFNCGFKERMNIQKKTKWSQKVLEESVCVCYVQGQYSACVIDDSESG